MGKKTKVEKKISILSRLLKIPLSEKELSSLPEELVWHWEGWEKIDRHRTRMLLPRGTPAHETLYDWVRRGECIRWGNNHTLQLMFCMMLTKQGKKDIRIIWRKSGSHQYYWSSFQDFEKLCMGDSDLATFNPFRRDDYKMKREKLVPAYESAPAPLRASSNQGGLSSIGSDQSSRGLPVYADPYQTDNIQRERETEDTHRTDEAENEPTLEENYYYTDDPPQTSPPQQYRPIRYAHEPFNYSELVPHNVRPDNGEITGLTGGTIAPELGREITTNDAGIQQYQDMWINVSGNGNQSIARAPVNSPNIPDTNTQESTISQALNIFGIRGRHS